MDDSSKRKEIVQSSPKETTFEDVLHECGGFGRFQLLVLVVLLFPEIPAAFVAFAPVFVGKSVSNWTCLISSDNDTDAEETIWMGADMCDCPGTLFLADDSTFVSEWGLVCSNAWVSDFITSVQMLGMLLGSLFSSQISDWYGRKWVYLGVCVLMGFGQALSAFASGPVFYAIARFFAGAGISGFMGMSTIYPLEFMTPEYRLLIGSVGPWGEGIMLLALLAYFVTPWRSLLLISSLPFLLVFIIIPLLPESPRYLLREGRFQETLDVLRKIQWMNGKGTLLLPSLNLHALGKIHEKDMSAAGPKRYSYLNFFRERSLRNRTLALMGIWFSWATVYFGISYNAKNLRGDVYVNMALMGAADALGYPAALLVNNKLGRRKSLILFMSCGAAFLVVLASLDLALGPKLSLFLLGVLSLVGKFFVAGARSAARILTGESFPTGIRTMGYGISGVTAGVGGIIAPQIAFFGSLWWSPLPFVTFALISVTGSLLSLLLPETAGKSLQEERSVRKESRSYGSSSSTEPQRC